MINVNCWEIRIPSNPVVQYLNGSIIEGPYIFPIPPIFAILSVGFLLIVLAGWFPQITCRRHEVCTTTLLSLEMMVVQQ